jgi:hypothetical protein
MTRDDFKKHVEETIEGIIQEGEKRAGHALPRRYSFGFCNPPRVTAEQDQVSEHLAQLVFVDEKHLYPCFDLILDDILDDGRLLFVGYRANYPPRPWGLELRNMNQWANKSLQATRDGRSSSASRFTHFGPACLSSGR